MLQDRLAGRRTEIETINGAVLAIGAGHGVAAPALQILTDLVRMGESK
jgi:2-dehydropantoate 2-reductase